MLTKEGKNVCREEGIRKDNLPRNYGSKNS